MRWMLRAIWLVSFAGAIGSQPAVAVQGDATAWGARDPGACPSINPKAAPSPAQVATMVRSERARQRAAALDAASD